MILVDVVLMALVSVAIVSFLVWSICTQYRDVGCEHLRVRRPLQIKPRLVTPDAPEVTRPVRVS